MWSVTWYVHHFRAVFVTLHWTPQECIELQSYWSCGKIFFFFVNVTVNMKMTINCCWKPSSLTFVVWSMLNIYRKGALIWFKGCFLLCRRHRCLIFQFTSPKISHNIRKKVFREKLKCHTDFTNRCKQMFSKADSDQISVVLKSTRMTKIVIHVLPQMLHRYCIPKDVVFNKAEAKFVFWHRRTAVHHM